MKNKTKNKSKLMFLTIAIAAAVAVGAWLFYSPVLEKQKALDSQSALLDSIAQGDGVIVLDKTFAAAPVDFYDEPDEVITTSVPSVPDGSPETTAPAAPSETQAAEAVTPAEPIIITGIGILSIEKIDLKLPVVDGVAKSQLKVAVGRVPQTAEIGAIGNAVIAGHRNYEYGGMFNRLGEMEIGDVVQYQPKNGEIMRFEVYEVLTIDSGDQSAFFQPDSESIITLYTCTPIRTATHRLLVRARLI